MANREWETDDQAGDGWVDDRLARLAARGEWSPDPSGALARLQARRSAKTRARAVAARRWIWTTVAAASAVAALLVLPASRACAEQPGPCVLRMLHVAAPAGSNVAVARPAGPAPSSPAPIVPMRTTAVPSLAAGATGSKSARLPIQANYKEAGSASAPIGIEVYIDYECPHCETFVRDVAPLLVEDYVRTGAAKLLYRDYPLPTHRYAKLAARYADAAGELGFYDTTMKRLFATRQAWSVDGDVEGQVAQVLPGNVMDQLRERLKSASDPDAELAADLAAGRQDHPDRVPFIVIVSGGKRLAITDAPLSFDVLKSKLDGLAGQLRCHDHGNMTIDETSDCRR